MDRRRTPSDGKNSHCLWQGELKRTNHDLQNIKQKTKDRATRTPLKTGVKSDAPEGYVVHSNLIINLIDWQIIFVVSVFIHFPIGYFLKLRHVVSVILISSGFPSGF